MADRRKHQESSECPLNALQVNELLETQKQMCEEIRAMRKVFITGRAVLWTVSSIAVAALWFFDRTDDVRSVAIKFLQGK